MVAKWGNSSNAMATTKLEYAQNKSVVFNHDYLIASNQIRGDSVGDVQFSERSVNGKFSLEIGTHVSDYNALSKVFS